MFTNIEIGFESDIHTQVAILCSSMMSASGESSINLTEATRFHSVFSVQD